jgi:hypothetical protein
MPRSMRVFSVVFLVLLGALPAGASTDMCSDPSAILAPAANSLFMNQSPGVPPAAENFLGIPAPTPAVTCHCMIQCKNGLWYNGFTDPVSCQGIFVNCCVGGGTVSC